MAVRELVGLKLDVGTDSKTGHAKYPDFNAISPELRGNMDWCHFLDKHGSGMHYDMTNDHQDDTPESPYGHQCCCICVPAEFAAEALRLFPDTVSECTDMEFEAFYDNKAHRHEPAENVDADTLSGLAAQRSLMVSVGQPVIALDVKIAKALDPNDETEIGVVVNKNKTWKQVMTRKGITVKKKAVAVE